MKKVVFFLDDGHGVETAGKRSPNDENGKPIMKENNVNESVMYMLSGMLYCYGIKHEIISPEDTDVSLGERVRRERELFYRYKEHGYDCIFLSIHADAFDPENDGVIEFNSANGFTVFVYNESNLELGKRLEKSYAMNANYKSRGVKYANFYLLRKTYSKAILLELGFMTNKEDLSKLIDNEERLKSAYGISQFCQEVVNL